MTLIGDILSATPNPGSLAVWGLGQMGVLLKTSSCKVILIDPVLSNVVAERTPSMQMEFKRAFPPPILPEEVTFADYVLCTHEHMDHADPLTLAPLAKASPQAMFITTQFAAPILAEAGISAERILFPPLNQPLVLDGITLWAIAAAHYEREIDPQKGARYLSFMLALDGIHFFHSGDTLLHPEWVADLHRLPRADAAMLAVNGRDPIRESKGVLGNLTPDEAVGLMHELGWGVLIPGHNDLFVWNSLPPDDLSEAAKRCTPEVQVKTVPPGGLLLITNR